MSINDAALILEKRRPVYGDALLSVILFGCVASSASAGQGRASYSANLSQPSPSPPALRLQHPDVAALVAEARPAPLLGSLGAIVDANLPVGMTASRKGNGAERHVTAGFVNAITSGPVATGVAYSLVDTTYHRVASVSNGPSSAANALSGHPSCIKDAPFGIISVKQAPFNAIGDGAARDDLAVQAAVNAACSFNPPAKVVFPQGGYWLFKAPVNVPARCSGLTIEGLGSRFQTSIVAANQSFNLFNNNGARTTFRHINFSSMGKATSGWAVAGSGSHDLEDVGVYDTYDGIYEAGQTETTYRHLYANGITHVAMQFDGTGDAHLVDDYIYEAAAQPNSSLLITGGGAFVLHALDLSDGGVALNISPSGGRIISSLLVSDSYFDTSNYGVFVGPDKESLVQRIAFSNSWFGDARFSGIKVVANTEGFQCTGCQFFNNGEYGIYWGGVGTNGLVVTGSLFAQNRFQGIELATDARAFNISGNTFGPYAGLANNGGCIKLNGGISNKSDDYVITNNLCMSGATGGISDGGAGSHKLLSNAIH